MSATPTIFVPELSARAGTPPQHSSNVLTTFPSAPSPVADVVYVAVRPTLQHPQQQLQQQFVTHEPQNHSFVFVSAIPPQQQPQPQQESPVVYQQQHVYLQHTHVPHLQLQPQPQQQQLYAPLTATPFQLQPQLLHQVVTPSPSLSGEPFVYQQHPQQLPHPPAPYGYSTVAMAPPANAVAHAPPNQQIVSYAVHPSPMHIAQQQQHQHAQLVSPGSSFLTISQHNAGSQSSITSDSNTNHYVHAAHQPSHTQSASLLPPPYAVVSHNNGHVVLAQAQSLPGTPPLEPCSGTATAADGAIVSFSFPTRINNGTTLSVPQTSPTTSVGSSNGPTSTTPHSAMPATPLHEKCCYLCNQPGHYARMCTTAITQTMEVQPLTCYRCQRQGHVAKHCPTRMPLPLAAIGAQPPYAAPHHHFQQQPQPLHATHQYHQVVLSGGIVDHDENQAH